MPKAEVRKEQVAVTREVETPQEVVGARFRPRMTVAEAAQKMVERGYDSEGRQIPDPVPMAPAVGFKESPSMVELIRKMVRDERLAADLERSGVETFDEADDFEVGEENEEELRSGFENEFEPPAVKAVRERVEASRKAAAKPPEKAQADLEEAIAKKSSE